METKPTQSEVIPANLEKISDYVTLNVKHVFSREELEEQSNLLAQAVKNKTHEEANKKVAMADFANKIKNLEAQINLHSGHINNGYTYQDRVCELYLDFTNKMRIYDDRLTGEHLKTEPFHQSDFEKRQLKMNLDEQIGENNFYGDIAESERPTPKDNLDPNYGKDFEPDDALEAAIDAVINEKKNKGKVHKPTAEDFVIGNGLYKDRPGNTTDIAPEIEDDPFEDLPE